MFRTPYFYEIWICFIPWKMTVQNVSYSLKVSTSYVFLINGVMIFPLIFSIESRIYVSNLTWVYPIVKNFLECASKNGSRGIQFQANFFVISFFSRFDLGHGKVKMHGVPGQRPSSTGGADYYFEEKGDKGFWKVDFKMFW